MSIRTRSGSSRREPRRQAAGTPTRRWLRLPAGRAVVGALLIVAALTSVFVAHRAASDPPRNRVLVATRSIPAGHTLSAADLGSVALDLPPGSSGVPLDDAESVIGRVTRHPLAEADLMRFSDLYEPQRFARPGSVEVVLELDPAGALHGGLSVGQAVDVLASSPDAAGTTTIVHGALVTGVADSDSGIGASGRTPVRLSVPDAATAELLVDAGVRSTVTLVLPSTEQVET